MRRKDKEISERSDIEAIIQKSKACRLGMIDGDKPYVIPLCFGYRDNVLYFHGSLMGHKIDLIRKNPNVCFEFDLITEITESEDACCWTMKYQSVVGFGKAAFVDRLDDKVEALSIIMNQYSDRAYRFPDSKLEATAVFTVEIENMTGKQSGF